MTRQIFKGGLVFDGTGADPYAADVAVEDGRFAAVGRDLRGEQIVDVRGRTLLPGLFDTHVHVLGVEPELPVRLAEPFSYQFYVAIRNLRSLLECGITTIRDCAGADLGVKRAVETGLIPGPRMRISITAISQTAGHMDGWTPSGEYVNPYYLPHPGRPGSIADGPEAVRRLVRQTVRAGADFVKVLCTDGLTTDPRRTHFGEAELAVLMAEARAAGLPVAAHAIGTEGVKNAVRAGARSIEHGAYLDEEAVQLMAARGTWLVPTLFVEPANMPAVLEAERDLGAVLYKAAEFDQAHVASFRAALAAGVPIAMGTDYGNDCGANLVQLLVMHEAGMPAERVLVSATSAAAELMGLAGELGTIEPGKRADLVVLDGDPYDFRAFKDNIRAVYQDGVLQVES
ncbi:amidohydrolase family protein [Nonomuraea sp. NPDC050540]|uniref:amidohydrolase family protein n=1 Tax=Nonomuraea sp. NPDC050540 TaxID=3364367 RepID=UPI00378B2521